MQDQRNLIMAIVLSVAILVGWQVLFAPEVEDRPAPPRTAETTPPVPGQTVPTPQIPGETPSAPSVPVDPLAARAGVLNADARIPINPNRAAGRVTGSIALRGARIDDLILTGYRETLDPDSPNIVLLSPKGAPRPYYADFLWLADKTTDVDLPGPDTVWTADRDRLKVGEPVTLRWNNDGGLGFTRTIAIDDDYMFTITDRVENTGAAPVSLFPYARLSRTDEPPTMGFFILHEGPLGVFDGTLDEVDYEDLRDDGDVSIPSTGGWIGITDKFWLTALIPGKDVTVTGSFRYQTVDGREKFLADYMMAEQPVAADGAVEITHRLFAGAKEVTRLDAYEKELEITNFDRAIDFGWFYFLTKPLFYVLSYFNGLLGNIGLAIMLLTVIVKLLFFPLANKSYVAMSKMKKLQPEMKVLREKFGDDKLRLNSEMMALYKREKANPLAGCLPMVIQIPVFFALYKVMFVTIEMRHAPFYGWIKDLSAPDPTTMFNLFGLIPWTPPDFLTIGVWPLIMGGSMFLQQKLNPAPPDPVQAKVFMMLPIVFTALFATFPAGLVIYWAWNNVLSIAQQWVIMRRMGVKM